MRIVERQKWQQHEDANQDKGYGESVTIFSTLWASLMEIAILFEDKAVEEVAESCGKQADALMGRFGVTGFQYGCAISLLAQTWQFGEQLRRWHNLRSQIHDEGTKANKKPGAVLNPAILRIGDD